MKYTSRYPGSRPFEKEEKDIFFGRSNDTETLYNLVRVEKTVLLYSKSGLGKSSIISAGLIPKIANKNYNYFLIRLGACSEDNRVSPKEKIIESLQKEDSDDFLIKFPEFYENTIGFWLKSLQFNSPDKTNILIFDQFEELFTYPDKQIDEVKRELSELIYMNVSPHFREKILQLSENKPDTLSENQLISLSSAVNIRLLFAIRSDSLSMLNRLTDYLPNLQRTFFELKPLDKNDAISAITKPATKEGDFACPKFEFSEDAVHKILSALSDNFEQAIETFQLQIVCQYAESIVSKNPEHKIILPADLGNINDIHESFYNNTIAGLKTENDGEKQRLRILLEEQFIFEPAKRRLQVFEGIILSKISRQTLLALEKTHIIRAEPYQGLLNYELSHDSLVAPILKSLGSRKEEEERLRLKKRKSFIANIFTGSLFCILFVFFFIIFISYLNRINHNNKDSQQHNYETACFKKDAKLFNKTIYYYDYEEIDTLDLSYHNLEFLPVEVGKCTNLKFINLIGNKFKSYKSTFDALSMLNQLEEIKISTDNIDSIPSQFNKLISGLVLTSNNLKSTIHNFSNYENLKSLSLAYNNLTMIPPEICSLSNLSLLDLSNNNLNILPVEIKKLTNLKILLINHNKFKTLPIEILELKNLEELSMESNQLGKISTEINKLSNIRKLCLNNVSINELPKRLDSLKNLTELYLDNNKFYEFPIGICDLTKLEILSLNNNSLSYLPEKLKYLTNLRVFNLDNNNFKFLPFYICLLNKLKRLSFNMNKLVDLPECLSLLKNLSYLSISSNRLSTFPKTILKLKNLSYLIMSANGLDTLPNEFYNLNNLKIFKLNSNNLTLLPKSFGQLANLILLDLSNNSELKNLPCEIISLKNLKKINLLGNKNFNAQMIKVWGQIMPNCQFQIGSINNINNDSIYNQIN